MASKRFHISFARRPNFLTGVSLQVASVSGPSRLTNAGLLWLCWRLWKDYVPLLNMAHTPAVQLGARPTTSA